MTNVQNNNAKNLYISSFLFGIKDRLIASFFIVFLLRLDASNFQISIYQILTASLGGIALFFLTSHIDNSKKSFLKSIFWDRFGFLVFSILLFFMKNPLYIIVLFGLYSMCYAVAGSLSPNYMKESIPKENWGRVFSNNKIFLVISSIISLGIIGRFLDIFNYIFPYNFIVMFLICSLIYFSSYFFIRKIDAKIKPVEKKVVRGEMFKNVDIDMFLIVFVYSPIFMLSPIWSIYHVSYLNFNNFQVGMLSAMFFIGGLLVLPFWGRLLDVYPNKKLFKIISLFMALIPLVYIINNSYYYLLIIQFFMGLIANGFDVIVQNNLMANSQNMKYDYAYMSNFQIFQRLNRIIFPAVGIVLYSMIGSVATFLLVGLIRLVAALVTNLTMRDNNLKSHKVSLQR